MRKPWRLVLPTVERIVNAIWLDTSSASPTITKLADLKDLTFRRTSPQQPVTGSIQAIVSLDGGAELTTEELND